MCKQLCLPPSVMGEVYCFPRRQLIFSFNRRVIYHSKGLWEYIPESIPSDCTTIFKRIAGLRFHLKSLTLYINRFVSTSSINKWEAFFKISNQFSNYWRKTKKKNPTNSEAWILIKVRCVMSMDSSRQALLTNEKIFSNFGVIFRINCIFFE